MFDHPGEKLKNWATILFWINIIACIILALCLSISKTEVVTGYYSHKTETVTTFNHAVFWPMIIGGPIASYVFSLILYGFGELIENSEKQIAAVKYDRSEKHSAAVTHESTDRQNTVYINCPQCGRPQNSTGKVCAACGAELHKTSD